MWYSIAIFVYTVFVGGVMLISGKHANKKKRHHEFLMDKISEKKSARLEDELRDKQAAEYAERVALAAAKEEEKANYAINEPHGGNELLSGTRNWKQTQPKKTYKLGDCITNNFNLVSNNLNSNHLLHLLHFLFISYSRGLGKGV